MVVLSDCGQERTFRMKTVLQYLFALVLVILGIALLCNPSRPATMTSELQSSPDSELPGPRPAGASGHDEARLIFIRRFAEDPRDCW